MTNFVFSVVGPLYGKGSFKCYVTLFFGKLDPHPPPRNANNIEHYTFAFSGKYDPPPHRRYVTLEWPPMHFLPLSISLQGRCMDILTAMTDDAIDECQLNMDNLGLRASMVFAGLWLSGSVRRNRRFHEWRQLNRANTPAATSTEHFITDLLSEMKPLFCEYTKEQHNGYDLNGTNGHYEWLNLDNTVIFIELSKMQVRDRHTCWSKLCMRVCARGGMHACMWGRG